MMLSFILRMAMPQLKFIFIPLFLYFTGYVVHTVIINKKLPGLKRFISAISIYLVLLVIYLIAIIYRTDFYLPVKEWVSGFIILVLFYFFYYFVVEENITFERLKKIFSQQLVVIITVISLTGLLKFIFSASGRAFPLSTELAQNAFTSSLTSDYNFFSLAVLFGMITLLHQYYQRKQIGKKELMGDNLLMVLFSLVILTSQSRRSFLILLAIILLIVAVRIFIIYYSEESPGKFFKRNDGFLLSMAIVCLVGYVFMFLTSDQIKTQVIRRSGLYQSGFRIELTNAVNRYARLLGSDYEQMELYKLLWNQDDRPQAPWRKEIKQWVDNQWLDMTYTDHNLGKLPDLEREGISENLKKGGSEEQSKDIQEKNSIWQNSLFSRLKTLFTEKEPALSGEEATLMKHNRTVLNGGRKMRWEYALQLFSGYPLTGKLFGNGFTYLNRFGEKFRGSANTYEYPHNPLISSLLYSGIIGAGIYLFFVIYTFVLYLRNLKALRYFFLLFLVTTMYMAISGNSHFSVPAYSFLGLLPWVYVGLKNKSEA